MKHSIWVSAICALLAGAFGQARADLIVNGGFEDGNFTGWTVFGNQSYNFVTTGSGGITPHSGSYFATNSNFAAQGDSGWYQTVTDTPGESYVLTFWHTMNGGDLSHYEVQWNNTVLLDLINYPSYNAVWQEADFIVIGTGNDTVTFTGFQQSGYNGTDDISLDAVTTAPEPATFTLLAIGAACMALATWRRRVIPTVVDATQRSS